MADTDWIQLWHDLVNRFKEEPEKIKKKMMERWSKRAYHRGYTEDQRKSDRDDPLIQFVLERLQPNDTVLDIGAGVGRWSIPMAMVCKKVTALDTLPGMLEIIRENAAEENVNNIETVLGDWEQVDIEPHDFTLSSHAVYFSPDIVSYARKMERFARKACYMVMRVPSHDGVLADLSRHFYGTWHDSPNFIVGYNALLQAGIMAHVIMEEKRRFWHNETLEKALSRVKRHLHLKTDNYNGMIMETLKKHLVLRKGEYWWPDWMRSALIWWRSGTN